MTSIKCMSKCAFGSHLFAINLLFSFDPLLWRIRCYDPENFNDMSHTHTIMYKNAKWIVYKIEQSSSISSVTPTMSSSSISQTICWQVWAQLSYNGMHKYRRANQFILCKWSASLCKQRTNTKTAQNWQDLPILVMDVFNNIIGQLLSSHDLNILGNSQLCLNWWWSIHNYLSAAA